MHFLYHIIYVTCSKIATKSYNFVGKDWAAVDIGEVFRICKINTFLEATTIYGYVKEACGSLSVSF